MLKIKYQLSFWKRYKQQAFLTVYCCLDLLISLLICQGINLNLVYVWLLLQFTILGFTNKADMHLFYHIRPVLTMWKPWITQHVKPTHMISHHHILSTYLSGWAHSCHGTCGVWGLLAGVSSPLPLSRCQVLNSVVILGGNTLTGKSPCWSLTCALERSKATQVIYYKKNQAVKNKREKE